MTTKLLFMPFCLCILIYCFLLLGASSKIIGSNKHTSATSDTTASQNILQVSSTIINKRYCSSGQLRLMIRLTLRNKGEVPIVLQKDYFRIVRTVISSDLESAERGRYKLDKQAMVTMSFTKLVPLTPQNPRFVILKKGESLYVDVEDRIPFSDFNLLRGEHIVQETIFTWGGPSKLGDELKQKWYEDGLLLWLDEIITEPMMLSLDSLPIDQKCS